MTERWRPIHENHAIDVMAAVIRFSQPLPDLVFKRAAKAAEAAAFGNGLKSRHIESGVAFNLGFMGAGEPFVAQPQARVFNSVREDPAGEPIPGILSEQVRIDAQSIIYRTWNYVSWSWQRDRISTLMSGALLAVQEVVELASIRLEYLDRFWFDGPIASAKTGALLRKDSDLIASHVFDRDDLWHCHTGAFLGASSSQRPLLQITLDALDQPGPTSESGQVRWVNISTARENRYVNEAVDERPWTTDFVTDMLDLMHAELKDALASVILDDMAEAIYLKA